LLERVEERAVPLVEPDLADHVADQDGDDAAGQQADAQAVARPPEGAEQRPGFRRGALALVLDRGGPAFAGDGCGGGGGSIDAGRCILLGLHVGAAARAAAQGGPSADGRGLRGFDAIAVEGAARAPAAQYAIALRHYSSCRRVRVGTARIEAGG